MKELKFLRERPIAHRGLFNKKEGIPENSIPAFERAIQENYPIELDVHLLVDGNIVIFHDDNLARMTGMKKKIKECTYDEIKDLKLNNTKYGIPLFSEVLDLVQGRVPILIEFKYDRKAGETEKRTMELLVNYKGKYAVQSFSPSSLIWFKKNYPDVPRGQLSADYRNERMIIIKKIILRNLYLNFLTKPYFISYGINGFPNKRVQKWKDSGNLVLAWTIKNNQDLEKVKNECNNIIGENLNQLDLSILRN